MLKESWNAREATGAAANEAMLATVVPTGSQTVNPSYDAAGSSLPPRRVQIPELRLMAAVLAEAIDDYRRYAGSSHPRARRIFRETEEWFAALERSGPYSFEHIAAALDLDADAVRGQLGSFRAGAESSVPMERAHLRRISGSRARQVALHEPPHCDTKRRVA